MALICRLPQRHRRVRSQGQQQWAYDSRGSDGQGAPLEFDTGMGEVPEVGAQEGPGLANGVHRPLRTQATPVPPARGRWLAVHAARAVLRVLGCRAAAKLAPVPPACRRWTCACG